MAKRWPATPTLYGKDAEAVQDEIVNGTPDTPERVATIRRADAMWAKIKVQMLRKSDRSIDI